jgi:hypothetical protein
MSAGLVMLGFFLFINLTLGVMCYRALRVVLPGLRVHGTPEEPRMLVRGIARGTPDSTLRAPLSGRPCLAWRLRMRPKGGTTLSMSSGGSFVLQDGETPTRLEFEAYQSRVADSTTFFCPPPFRDLSRPQGSSILRPRGS